MKQQIKKLKGRKTLGWVEASCMLKVFYIALWKQLCQYKNKKRNNGIVGRWNNLRITIVGKKLKHNRKSMKKNSKEKKTLSSFRGWK